MECRAFCGTSESSPGRSPLRRTESWVRDEGFLFRAAAGIRGDRRSERTRTNAFLKRSADATREPSAERCEMFFRPIPGFGPLTGVPSNRAPGLRDFRNLGWRRAPVLRLLGWRGGLHPEGLISTTPATPPRWWGPRSIVPSAAADGTRFVLGCLQIANCQSPALSFAVCQKPAASSSS